jgi:hypothetical protein
MPALPLDLAANELKVSPSTVRAWASAGAPVFLKARGRGRRSLYDPEAIQRWRDGDTSTELRAFCERIPELIDEAVRRAHDATPEPRKRQSAPILALLGYEAISGLLEAAGVDAIRELPQTIERLRKY